MFYYAKKIATGKKKLPKSDNPEDLVRYFTISSKKKEKVNQNIYDILRDALLNNKLELLTPAELAKGIALFTNIFPVEAADILNGKLIPNKEVAATLFNDQPDVNDLTRIKLIAEFYKLLESKTFKTPLHEKIETVVLALREDKSAGATELAKIDPEELMDMFNVIYAGNKTVDDIFNNLTEKMDLLTMLNELIERHSYHLPPKTY